MKEIKPEVIKEAYEKPELTKEAVSKILLQANQQGISNQGYLRELA